MKDYMRALVSRVTLSILSVGEEERGQGMVEYSLVLVLVAMGCVLAFTGLATRIGTALSGVTF
jgi:Flp pilus assembly pilin Flp